MYSVRSRTFCCCLPVRFGVFVITILGFVGGVAYSALGWRQIAKPSGQVSTINEIAAYIHSIIYTLLAIMSIFGFIGAIRRHRTMVSVFFSMLVAHLTFSVFSGAFTLYNIFNHQALESIQSCIAGSPGTPGLSPSDCKRGFEVGKGIAVTIFILVWLLEIWGCVITNSYVTQLDEEAMAQWKVGSDIEVNQVSGPRPL